MSCITFFQMYCFGEGCTSYSRVGRDLGPGQICGDWLGDELSLRFMCSMKRSPYSVPVVTSRGKPAPVSFRTQPRTETVRLEPSSPSCVYNPTQKAAAKKEVKKAPEQPAAPAAAPATTGASKARSVSARKNFKSENTVDSLATILESDYI